MPEIAAKTAFEKVGFTSFTEMKNQKTGIYIRDARGELGPWITGYFHFDPLFFQIAESAPR